jgi:drug/metabolite transporter (DMT)-like permease
MIIGPSLWTIGYIFPNEHKFHPVTTNLVRGITVTIISYIIARYQGIDLTFGSAHNFKYQMLRNSIMVLQGIVYAWCQFYLPLPIAVTLNSTSPIFATIFDRVLNGVSINRTQALWLTVAFLGVVLVANGEYLSYLMTGVVAEGSSTF